jgi:hypothetical protein
MLAGVQHPGVRQASGSPRERVFDFEVDVADKIGPTYSVASSTRSGRLAPFGRLRLYRSGEVQRVNVNDEQVCALTSSAQS